MVHHLISTLHTFSVVNDVQLLHRVCVSGYLERVETRVQNGLPSTEMKCERVAVSKVCSLCDPVVLTSFCDEGRLGFVNIPPLHALSRLRYM